MWELQGLLVYRLVQANEARRSDAVSEDLVPYAHLVGDRPASDEDLELRAA